MPGLRALAGLRVLVTGASSGIGASVCEMLAQRGCRVAGSGRSPGPLLVAPAGPLEAAIVADLTEPGAPEQVVADAAAALGGIDVVISNAGAGWSGPYESMPAAEIDDILDINLRAPMHLAQAAAPYLRHSAAGGQLILVGSIAGLVGVADEVAYATAKAGLRGLADSLRAEWSSGAGGGSSRHAAAAFNRGRRGGHEAGAGLGQDGTPPGDNGNVAMTAGTSSNGEHLQAFAVAAANGGPGSRRGYGGNGGTLAGRRDGTDGGYGGNGGNGRALAPGPGGAGRGAAPGRVTVTLVSLGPVDTPFYSRRNRPYLRSWPKPIPVSHVAHSIAGAIEHRWVEVVVPAWLGLPARLNGGSPALYRALAAMQSRLVL